MGTLNERQQRLLAAHRSLDTHEGGFAGEGKTRSSRFVSGWETVHTVHYEHFVPQQVFEDPNPRDLNYAFLSDDGPLKRKIRHFHERVDRQLSKKTEIFVGAGSSPLITALMMLFSELGARSIYYTRPAFHQFYYLASILNLSLLDVGQCIAGEEEVSILDSLPNDSSVLLITDPSWISGHFASEEFWRRLRHWQTATGSLVLVDGTFQYTKWHSMEMEFSSLLDPENTIRLICPTKSLCVHCLRFSYLLLPARYIDQLGFIYTKVAGSSSANDIRMANALMDQLSSEANNRELVAHIRDKCNFILQNMLITDPVVMPKATYYVFGRSGFEPSSATLMNCDFFELDYPADFVRVNVLSPDLPTEARAKASVQQTPRR